MSFKAFLLRWLISLAHIVDGLLGLITMGMWRTTVTLSTAKVFAKANAES